MLRSSSRPKLLNQLFDEKAFSWTLAMEAMETVLPGGVQVTSIEPIRDKDGHITVHVRVVGPRDRADDLVANLEHSRRFLQPRIVGESAESSNSPSQRQEPISISNRFDFDLLADYNPPTSGGSARYRQARAQGFLVYSASASPIPNTCARILQSRKGTAASPTRVPRPPAPVRSSTIPRVEVRNERERIIHFPA